MFDSRSYYWNMELGEGAPITVYILKLTNALLAHPAVAVTAGWMDDIGWLVNGTLRGLGGGSD